MAVEVIAETLGWIPQQSEDGKGWKLAQTLPAPGGANNTDFGRKVWHVHKSLYHTAQ